MLKNLSIFNFKKAPKAFGLSLIIVLVINCVELFVLPINFFTFRVWESLAVTKDRLLLPGPFYPNMTIAMVEEGDLRAHSKYAVKKDVVWFTDKYGYRKRNESVDQYEIVVIGNSFVVGSSLTQADTFSEQLEKRLNLKVYPLANADINVFLRDPRFRENRPGIVILASVERFINLSNLPEIQKEIPKNLSTKINYAWAGVLYDRLTKQLMIKSLLARVGRLKVMFSPFYSERSENQVSEMAFMSMNSLPVPQERIEAMVHKIKAYKEKLNERGIRFIFLPIPNKETIYWAKVPLTNSPLFLEELTFKLKKANIEVVDVKGSYEEAVRRNDALLYHLDDTHWNREGVRLAVDIVEKYLK